MVSFRESIRLGVTQVFDPSGHSTRAEFWWYQVFIFLMFMPFLLLVKTFPQVPELRGMFVLALAVATISILIRRIRDAGGGNWLFPAFAGSITLLYSLAVLAVCLFVGLILLIVVSLVFAPTSVPGIFSLFEYMHQLFAVIVMIKWVSVLLGILMLVFTILPSNFFHRENARQEPHIDQHAQALMKREKMISDDPRRR